MSKNPLEKYAKLYDYLKNFSVYEERNIAREIGVPSPTTKTKNENIDYIVNICAGLKEPSPRSNKGAPTKSLLVDKKWLEDIRSLTDQIREKETYRESDSDERIHVSDSGHTLRFGYGSDLASGYLDSDPASGKFCLVYNRKGSIFSDISVPKNLVALHDLRRGDKVSGYLRDNADGGELAQVESVNSLLPEEVRSRRRFEEFTPCFANEIVRLGKKEPPLRALDILSPLGKGQRVLISGPASSGKSYLIKQMVSSLTQGDANLDVIVLLLAARPEEVTAFRKIVRHGELLFTAFDMPERVQMQVATLAFEHAKRQSEYGRDVILFVDGMTDLVNAFSERARTNENGERWFSSAEAKRFYALARNFEENGSLTIVASMRTDEEDARIQNIYKELKSAANKELRLSLSLREKRIFPPVDFARSRSYNDDALLSEAELDCMARVKKSLVDDGALAEFYRTLAETDDDQEFLLRFAAQE